MSNRNEGNGLIYIAIDRGSGEFSSVVPAQRAGQSYTHFTANMDGQSAGVAVTRWSGDNLDMTLHLETIYVHDQYRLQGVAKELLNEVASWAEEQGFAQVQADFTVRDGVGKGELLRFFTSCGFARHQLTCRTYRFSVERLQATLKTVEIGGEVAPFSAFSQGELETFGKIFDQANANLIRYPQSQSFGDTLAQCHRQGSFLFLHESQPLAYVTLGWQEGEAVLLSHWNGTQTQMVSIALAVALVGGLAGDTILSVPVFDSDFLRRIHDCAPDCAVEIVDQMTATLPF